MAMSDPFEVGYSGLMLAGVDEVGRGPLAGEVVAAAVILDPLRPIDGLRDSKKLSKPRREELSRLIRERALAWSIASASVIEIDELNILHASMLAMQRAVQALDPQPEYVLVDGNRLPRSLYLRRRCGRRRPRACHCSSLYPGQGAQGQRTVGAGRPVSGLRFCVPQRVFHGATSTGFANPGADTGAPPQLCPGKKTVHRWLAAVQREGQVA